MVDTGFISGLVIGIIAGFATGMIYGREKEMTKEERNRYSMLMAVGMIVAFIGIVILILTSSVI